MAVFQPEIVPVRYAGNPIIPLVTSSWYEQQIYDFQVIVDPSDSTKLVMYASGMAGSTPAVGMQTIGRLTATVANPYVWTDHGQVIVQGGSGAWDAGGIRMGSLQYVGGTYYIFYSGQDAAATTESVGLATSTDGITFTKSASNPILTPTGNGSNDGTHVSEPAVLYEAGAWTMIYGYRNAPSSILAGYRYATSSNGTAWTKSGTGDVLSAGKASDGTLLYMEYHQLIKIDGIYYLFYESGSGVYPYRCYAASSSSVAGPYSKLATGPILPESSVVSAFDRYHTATPFVMQIAGNWKLFYCGAGSHDQPYGTNTWPGGIAEWPVRAYTAGRR